MKKYLTNNSQETFELGRELARALNPGNTILLFGDLGAGKTTFTQGIAKGLGVSDRILSPTFVLIRTHAIKGKISKLNHIDLYRIEKPAEVQSLGLGEIIEEKDSISVIEWAERLMNYKQKLGYSVRFKHLEGDKREIQIVPMGVSMRDSARMRFVGKKYEKFG